MRRAITKGGRMGSIPIVCLALNETTWSPRIAAKMIVTRKIERLGSDPDQSALRSTIMQTNEIIDATAISSRICDVWVRAQYRIMADRIAQSRNLRESQNP